MFDALIKIIVDTWDILGEMAPYLLFGFLMAGLLSAFISADLIKRHLGGRGILQVFKAALLGMPMPLCSCGVIPVAASLRKHGASSGATIAFLITTPHTGIDNILVVYGLLGLVFAIFTPIVTFINGIIGGLLVNIVGSKDTDMKKEEPVCNDACCTGETPKSKFLYAMDYAFITLPRDIGKALLVGLLISGMISALVPDNFLSGTLGSGLLGMLVMMAVGIPMYVCATASVPIAATLIAKGISPGAALVFLMTGPATNAAAIAIVWKTMGGRTAVTYLLSVALTALGSGILLNYIYTSGGLSSMPGMPWMLPPIIRHISAIILLAVLMFALFKPASEDEIHDEVDLDEESLVLTVKGMTCSHCAASVESALSSSPGVNSAKVDLKSGRAYVRGKNLDAASLKGAVEGLGYNASAGNE